jgi:hypothetical protein
VRHLRRRNRAGGQPILARREAVALLVRRGHEVLAAGRAVLRVLRVLGESRVVSFRNKAGGRVSAV